MMIKRLMCLAMTSIFCLHLSVSAAHNVEALTSDQQNIVHWADHYYDALWISQNDVSGWRGKHTFLKGESYRLPYGQPVEAGVYIGFGVDLEEFLHATDDPESLFYTQQSEYADKYSTYYATDCSGFVSMCWGVPRNTTCTLGEISEYLGNVSLSSVRTVLQMGDAINSAERRHVVLVTDLNYGENGSLLEIEITEQTPPQLKRSVYTPEELVARYGEDYGIYRYSGSVPAAPNGGYLSLCKPEDSIGQAYLKVNTGIMSLPCETEICEESKLIAVAKTQEIYAVTGVYRNTEQELWYEVRMETGETGYFLACAAKLSSLTL